MRHDDRGVERKYILQGILYTKILESMTLILTHQRDTKQFKGDNDTPRFSLMGAIRTIQWRELKQRPQIGDHHILI